MHGREIVVNSRCLNPKWIAVDMSTFDPLPGSENLLPMTSMETLTSSVYDMEGTYRIHHKRRKCAKEIIKSKYGYRLDLELPNKTCIQIRSMFLRNHISKRIAFRSWMPLAKQRCYRWASILQSKQQAISIRPNSNLITSPFLFRHSGRSYSSRNDDNDYYGRGYFSAQTRGRRSFPHLHKDSQISIILMRLYWESVAKISYANNWQFSTRK